MSWMKYNKETGQIDLLPYISELSDFQAIVMDEHTWNIICKRSASAAPGKAKGRVPCESLCIAESTERNTPDHGTRL